VRHGLARTVLDELRRADDDPGVLVRVMRAQAAERENEYEELIVKLMNRCNRANVQAIAAKRGVPPCA
jgi:RNA-binding protein YhbY